MNKNGLPRKNAAVLSPKERAAKYWAEHKHIYNARRSATSQERTDGLRAYIVARRAANLEENRARERALKQKRRIIAKGLLCCSTTKSLKADIDRIMELQEGKCAALHCRVDIRERNHVDHIIPIYYAGTNDSCNLQLLCPRCNLSKGKLHPSDWHSTMWWKNER